MAYTLVILKAAADDTKEAYDYYEEIQTGLGDRFLAEVLVRFNEISHHPQYYGFIDAQHSIRDVKLKSFPYLVVYEMEDNSVIVYSIHCAYRNPDKRLKK
ncbi:MAG: type II toxin-antitoxin system RelE/ParE family toxin [Ferruginibacter sp.]